LTRLLKELTWQGRNMHLNQLSKIVQKSILKYQNYKGLRIYQLIICGAADKLIPVEHSKQFNKVLKHSQLQIVEYTGHTPFSEKPSMVFDIMRIFLTNNK
jgi:pimeloyl-ACP methyl ester carboxylesterase